MDAEKRAAERREVHDLEDPTELEVLTRRLRAGEVTAESVELAAALGMHTARTALGRRPRLTFSSRWSDWQDGFRDRADLPLSVALDLSERLLEHVPVTYTSLVKTARAGLAEPAGARPYTGIRLVEESTHVFSHPIPGPIEQNASTTIRLVCEAVGAYLIASSRSTESEVLEAGASAVIARTAVRPEIRHMYVGVLWDRLGDAFTIMWRLREHIAERPSAKRAARINLSTSRTFQEWLLDHVRAKLRAELLGTSNPPESPS